MSDGNLITENSTSGKRVRDSDGFESDMETFQVHHALENDQVKKAAKVSNRECEGVRSVKKLEVGKNKDQKEQKGEKKKEGVKEFERFWKNKDNKQNQNASEKRKSGEKRADTTQKDKRSESKGDKNKENKENRASNVENSEKKRDSISDKKRDEKEKSREQPKPSEKAPETQTQEDIHIKHQPHDQSHIVPATFTTFHKDNPFSLYRENVCLEFRGSESECMTELEIRNTVPELGKQICGFLNNATNISIFIGVNKSTRTVQGISIENTSLLQQYLTETIFSKIQPKLENRSHYQLTFHPVLFNNTFSSVLQQSYYVLEIQLFSTHHPNRLFTFEDWVHFLDGSHLHSMSFSTFVSEAKQRLIFTKRDSEQYWESLLSEERKNQIANCDSLLRTKIYSLLQQFKEKDVLLEQWVNDKEAFLQAQSGVTLDSLYAVQTRIKMMEGFEQEYFASKPRLVQVEALEKQLIDLNYQGKDEIAAKKDALEQKWKNLANLILSRKQYFAEQLEKQQRMEDLRIEFARQAKEFDRWLKDAYEKARDSNFGESKEAVEAFLEELTSEEQLLKDASNERKAKLDVVHQQLEALEVKENKYTVLSIEDIINRMHTLDELLSARQTAYEKEILRQQAMEDKRKEFANAAQEFVQYIDVMRKVINEVGGEAQEHKAGVLAAFADGTEGKQKLEALSTLDQEMKQMGISNNSHTPYTFIGLSTRWDQYVNYITNLLTSLDEDVALNAKFEEMKREWAHKEHIENQKIEFANRANGLNAFIQNANEIATDPIIAKSLQAVQVLNIEFANLEDQFKTHSQSVEALKDLDNYLKQEGATENTLSSFTFDDIEKKWSDLNALLDTRRAELEAETQRQHTNDELCKEFASQASHINEWISQEVNKVAQSGTAGETLEVQQADLLVRLEELSNFSINNIDKLFQIARNVQEAHIEDNIYTTLTLNEIEIKWEHLLTNIQQRQKFVEEEIHTQKYTSFSFKSHRSKLF